MTLRLRLPQFSEVGALLPTAGGEAINGAVMPTPKVAPPPARISIPFRTLAMACANFKITTPTRLTGMLHPVLGQKTSLPPNHFRFGGQSGTRHCHGDAFPSQCRTNFSHRQTDNDRYLVNTGATLSIVPCKQNSSPSCSLRCQIQV